MDALAKLIKRNKFLLFMRLKDCQRFVREYFKIV